MHRHMFMILRTCWTALFFGISLGHGQSDDQTLQPRFAFLPGKILVAPLTANPHEPRTGLRKEVGTSRMKLDIGSTLDIVEYRPWASPDTRLSLGIDFFTYALTTSAEGLRLQVDAVDGFFGGHITFRTDGERTSFSARLRILHLSAHFLDGHYDAAQAGWKDGRTPIPFTRDFGELLGSLEWKSSSLSLRVYSGVSYATLIRPTEIERFATLHGGELWATDLLGGAFGKPLVLFAADNLTLAGIPRYVGTNNAELGVKFGDWSGQGVKLFVYHTSGLELFSQYYDLHRTSWGVGFTFDVW